MGWPLNAGLCSLSDCLSGTPSSEVMKNYRIDLFLVVLLSLALVYPGMAASPEAAPFKKETRAAKKKVAQAPVKKAGAEGKLSFGRAALAETVLVGAPVAYEG